MYKYFLIVLALILFNCNPMRGCLETGQMIEISGSIVDSITNEKLSDMKIELIEMNNYSKIEVPVKSIKIEGMALGFMITDLGSNILYPCYAVRSKVTFENNDSVIDYMEVPRLSKYIP